MRTAVLLMAVAALLTACATGIWHKPPRPEVWLLMGQSNMSGRGDVSELPADFAVPDPRIMVWGNDGGLAVASEPVDSAVGQVDRISADVQAGVGPGLAFARVRIAQQPNRRLILVPCAKGGSAIAEWTPADGRDGLFGSCVARARAAVRQGRLAGVLWYQGERDARSVDDALAWPARFERMATALRIALARQDLPIVVVSLADEPVRGPYAGRYPAWQAVQAAQASLRVPGVVVVAAAGLPKGEDDLHLSTAGQILLGTRLASALELQK
jgi:hypothetical protein